MLDLLKVPPRKDGPLTFAPGVTDGGDPDELLVALERSDPGISLGDLTEAAVREVELELLEGVIGSIKHTIGKIGTPHWNPIQHPRWPKNTPDAGQFMEVGQRFELHGKEYDVAGTFPGYIHAHVATKGETAGAATVRIDDKELAKAVRPKAEPMVGYPRQHTSGAPQKKAGTTTVVDIHAHPETHDPSIPIPDVAKKRISPEQWQRFGKLDQELFSQLCDKYGDWSPGASNAKVQAALKLDSAVASVVKQGWSSQGGQSSGTGLSLHSLWGHVLNLVKGDAKVEKAREDFERARALQHEAASVMQWDLYNRTRAPDVAMFHKDQSHGPEWMQTYIVDQGYPFFPGVSMSQHYREKFWASTCIAVPIAIRHVVQSYISSGIGYSSNEDEVAIGEAAVVDKNRTLVFSSSSLGSGVNKWLSDVTKTGGSGEIIEMLSKAMHDPYYDLPIPDAEPVLVMDKAAAAGHSWNDPPPEVFALVKGWGTKKNAAGETVAKLKWVKTNDDGEPVPKPANDLRLEAGDFIQGNPGSPDKGTIYVILADPTEPALGLVYYKLTEPDGVTPFPPGTAHTWDNAQTNQFKKIDAHLDLEALAKKQQLKEGDKLPVWNPVAWSQNPETKKTGALQPGEKFILHGQPYEVTGQAGTQTLLKALETGETGKINSDYKAVTLALKPGYSETGQVELSIDDFFQGEPKPLKEIKPKKGDVFKVGQTIYEIDSAGTTGGVYQVKGVAASGAKIGKIIEISPTADATPLIEKPFGWSAPQAGDTLAVDGKKGKVTKILKSGEVQVNMAPGVLKLKPTDPLLAGVFSPEKYELDDKVKLKTLPVGSKFHGGSGAKLRPYMVVEQKGKTTQVRSLDTGEEMELSAAKSFQPLVPKASKAFAPAGDHMSPSSIEGTFDPLAFEPGPQVKLGSLGAGDVFQTVGKNFKMLTVDDEGMTWMDLADGTVMIPAKHGEGVLNVDVTKLIPKGSTPAQPTSLASVDPGGFFLSGGVLWQKSTGLPSDSGNFYASPADGGKPSLWAKDTMVVPVPAPAQAVPLAVTLDPTTHTPTPVEYADLKPGDLVTLAGHGENVVWKVTAVGDGSNQSVQAEVFKTQKPEDYHVGYKSPLGDTSTGWLKYPSGEAAVTAADVTSVEDFDAAQWTAGDTMALSDIEVGELFALPQHAHPGPYKLLSKTGKGKTLNLVTGDTPVIGTTAAAAKKNLTVAVTKLEPKVPEAAPAAQGAAALVFPSDLLPNDSKTPVGQMSVGAFVSVVPKSDSGEPLPKNVWVVQSHASGKTVLKNLVDGSTTEAKDGFVPKFKLEPGESSYVSPLVGDLKPVKAAELDASGVFPNTEKKTFVELGLEQGDIVFNFDGPSTVTSVEGEPGTDGHVYHTLTHTTGETGIFGTQGKPDGYLKFAGTKKGSQLEPGDIIQAPESNVTAAAVYEVVNPKVGMKGELEVKVVIPYFGPSGSGKPPGEVYVIPTGDEFTWKVASVHGGAPLAGIAEPDAPASANVPDGSAELPATTYDPGAYVSIGESTLAQMNVGDIFVGAKNGKHYLVTKTGAKSGLTAIDLMTGKSSAPWKYDKKAEHLQPKSGVYAGGLPESYKPIQGDSVPIGKLDGGDHFLMGGQIFEVVAPPKGEAGEVVISKVGPDYSLGPAGTAGTHPFLMVTLHMKNDKVAEAKAAWQAAFEAQKVPPPVKDMDLDTSKLPDAAAAGGLVAFSPKSKTGGGYVFAKAKLAGEGTLLQGKDGSTWKVLQSGSYPVLTNGQMHFQVDSEANLKVVDVPFVDESPPLGTSVQDTQQLVAEAGQDPAPQGEATLGLLSLTVGSTFTSKAKTGKWAGTWQVLDTNKDGSVMAGQVGSAKTAAFPAGHKVSAFKASSQKEVGDPVVPGELKMGDFFKANSGWTYKVVGTGNGQETNGATLALKAVYHPTSSMDKQDYGVQFYGNDIALGSGWKKADPPPETGGIRAGEIDVGAKIKLSPDQSTVWTVSGKTDEFLQLKGAGSTAVGVDKFVYPVEPPPPKEFAHPPAAKMSGMGKTLGGQPVAFGALMKFDQMPVGTVFKPHDIASDGPVGPSFLKMDMDKAKNLVTGDVHSNMGSSDLPYYLVGTDADLFPPQVKVSSLSPGDKFHVGEPDKVWTVKSVETYGVDVITSNGAPGDLPLNKKVTPIPAEAEPPGSMFDGTTAGSFAVGDVVLLPSGAGIEGGYLWEILDPKVGAAEFTGKKKPEASLSVVWVKNLETGDVEWVGDTYGATKSNWPGAQSDGEWTLQTPDTGLTLSELPPGTLFAGNAYATGGGLNQHPDQNPTVWKKIGPSPDGVPGEDEIEFEIVKASNPDMVGTTSSIGGDFKPAWTKLSDAPIVAGEDGSYVKDLKAAGKLTPGSLFEDSEGDKWEVVGDASDGVNAQLVGGYGHASLEPGDDAKAFFHDGDAILHIWSPEADAGALEPSGFADGPKTQLLHLNQGDYFKSPISGSIFKVTKVGDGGAGFEVEMVKSDSGTSTVGEKTPGVSGSTPAIKVTPVYPTSGDPAALKPPKPEGVVPNVDGVSLDELGQDGKFAQGDGVVYSLFAQNIGGWQTMIVSHPTHPEMVGAQGAWHDGDLVPEYVEGGKPLEPDPPAGALLPGDTLETGSQLRPGQWFQSGGVGSEPFKIASVEKVGDNMYDITQEDAFGGQGAGLWPEDMGQFGWVAVEPPAPVSGAGDPVPGDQLESGKWYHDEESGDVFQVTGQGDGSYYIIHDPTDDTNVSLGKFSDQYYSEVPPPPGSEPEPLADALQPYSPKSQTGGGYKFGKLGQLPPGTTFTDKTGQMFTKASTGDSLYVDGSGIVYVADPDAKVKLVGDAPKTVGGPDASLYTQAAAAADGDFANLHEWSDPLAYFQSHYSEGGGVKTVRLSEVAPGSKYETNDGDVFVVAAKLNNQSVVHHLVSNEKGDLGGGGDFYLAPHTFAKGTDTYVRPVS